MAKTTQTTETVEHKNGKTIITRTVTTVTTTVEQQGGKTITTTETDTDRYTITVG